MEAGTGHRTGTGRKVVDLPGRRADGPRVSVVIPTYNNGGSLNRLLVELSMGEQPEGGMEIVVVDDGSADHTAAVAMAVGARYIWKPNGGTASARDRGWREACGDRIIFFDDDTVPSRDSVVLLDAALDHADAVGARFAPLRKQSLISDFTHADGLIDHRVVDGEVRWLITGAAGFRRSALEAVDGFDLGFIAAGEDVDLSIRMLRAGCRLAVEPRAVVHHDHRARFRQLLETCYRYGTFSRFLAARHPSYKGERLAMALRRMSPVELAKTYRGYRDEASRARSLTFLGLHELVAFPYALGLLQSRLNAKPLEAPSWRKVPAAGDHGVAVSLRGEPAASWVPAVKSVEEQPTAASAG